MTLGQAALVVATVLLAYLAGWVRGRAGRGQGGAEPTWYPPPPGRGYQPRLGAPGRPTSPPRETGTRLPTNPPRDT